jgi:hypothetical protein
MDDRLTFIDLDEDDEAFDNRRLTADAANLKRKKELERLQTTQQMKQTTPIRVETQIEKKSVHSLLSLLPSL